MFNWIVFKVFLFIKKGFLELCKLVKKVIKYKNNNVVIKKYIELFKIKLLWFIGIIKGFIFFILLL